MEGTDGGSASQLRDGQQLVATTDGADGDAEQLSDQMTLPATPVSVDEHLPATPVCVDEEPLLHFVM